MEVCFPLKTFCQKKEVQTVRRSDQQTKSEGHIKIKRQDQIYHACIHDFDNMR